MSTVEDIKSKIWDLDRKMSEIERLISQSDHNMREQMKNTANTLQNFENRVAGWLKNIGTTLSQINARPVVIPPPVNNVSLIISKLNNTESVLMGRISKAESILQSNAMKCSNISNNQTKTMQPLLTEIQDVNARLSGLEISVEKVREHTQEIKDRLQEPQLDTISNIDKHARALPSIQQLLVNISEQIRELPRINNVHHNKSQTLLQEVKHALKDVVTKGVNDLEDKLEKAKVETKETIRTLRMDLANNTERVNQELNDLVKGQSVMVLMADNVLDTKKRVEYGVHQILLELGDLVKAQGVNINNTLNQRFYSISNDIMDNQNAGLANLTTKMEQEINKVWPQINIMYQQLTESIKALEKLHKQNVDCANGTPTTDMDGLETKVGEITERIAEIDRNLNYLLGRLPLVTQEFNLIKTGLDTALDNIKASFKEVQDKPNDLKNPGPHPIPGNSK